MPPFCWRSLTDDRHPHRQHDGTARPLCQMKHALPYPPSWLDIAGLCQYFPISEASVDTYVKKYGFPPARMRGGKRVWKYAEVDAWYAGDDSIVPADDDVARQVYDATRKAVNAR